MHIAQESRKERESLCLLLVIVCLYFDKVTTVKVSGFASFSLEEVEELGGFLNLRRLGLSKI